MPTAAEVLAQLHADLNWAEAKAHRDADRIEVQERYRQEEKELVAELNNAGVSVKSVSDLITWKGTYKIAIPILFSHLKKPYSDNTREMIARALAVPESTALHDELIAEMRLQIGRDEVLGKGPKSIRNVVQGLAVAVAASTTEENISSLVALVKDESLGDDRLLFIRRLKKSKQASAMAVLGELANDPVFSKELTARARKLKKQD